jgi:multidrug efflux pump subunit AcrB
VHDRPGGVVAALNSRLRFFGRGFDWLRVNTYEPALKLALRWRYATIALAIAVFMFIIGLIASGRVEFSFFPKVESDRVNASVVLPFGAPAEETRKVQERLIAAARQVIAEHGGDRILRGIFAQVGGAVAAGGPGTGATPMRGGHMAGVSVYLVPIDQRSIRAEQFVQEWRKKAGDIPGLESLVFDYNTGPARGAPINIELSHQDNAVLERAAAELAAQLKGFDGVKDVDDGFTGGKPQLDFKVRIAAQSLGITSSDLARQVRGAFFGAEAGRNQRGRDEVRIYVRLPLEERQSLQTVENFIVRAPNGAEIPLREAADVIRGTSYTEIRRADGRRVLSVTGDVVQGQANPGKVISGLMQNELPKLTEKYPGLGYGFEGQQRDQRESIGTLMLGFLLSMLAIYFLLAIPFKNYVQPFIILLTVPFGIIGAVIGHIVLGYEVTVISLLGVVALAGVSVNTAIVLLDTANTQRAAGATAWQSIFHAGSRRFLPIVLTSVTTFFGLAPMIFETSVQARFLIPMAISLGVGILFSTAIALVLIPCLYLVVTDIRRLFGLEAKDEEASVPGVSGDQGGAPASAGR